MSFLEKIFGTNNVGLFHACPEPGDVLVLLFSIRGVPKLRVFDAQKIMTLRTCGVALFVQLPAVHLGKH